MEAQRRSLVHTHMHTLVLAELDPKAQFPTPIEASILPNGIFINFCLDRDPEVQLPPSPPPSPPPLAQTKRK